VSEVNDFLAHFGVKGMKWGVRKSESSKASKSSKKPSSETKKVVKEALILGGLAFVSSQIAMGVLTYAQLSPSSAGGNFVNQAIGQIGSTRVANLVDGVYDISTMRR